MNEIGNKHLRKTITTTNMTAFYTEMKIKIYWNYY